MLVFVEYSAVFLNDVIVGLALVGQFKVKGARDINISIIEVDPLAKRYQLLRSSMVY